MARTLFLSKQKALNFGASRRWGRVFGERITAEDRRELGVEHDEHARETLKEKCCSEHQCSNEEVEETPRIAKYNILCEVSLREDNGRCYCKSIGQRCGVTQYMNNKGGPRCDYPCKESEFLCDKERSKYEDGKSCISKTLKCNTVKDCLNNGNDEAGCKITDHLSVEQIKSTAKLTNTLREQGQGGYFEPAVTIGVAHVNERVVCKRVASEMISKETATVFCRTMKENGPNTIGVPIPAEAGVFDSKTSVPIMTNVKCEGGKAFIGDCDHDTYSSECSEQDGAVIGCIDPDRIRLRHGEVDRGNQGGILYFATANNDAAGKAICTTIFDSEFDRADKGVPLFRRVYRGDLINKPNWHLTVTCRNGVTDLAQCSITPEFGTQRWMEISCAQCKAKKLIAIVQSITNTGTADSVIESLEAAKESLKSQCLKWNDCHKEKPEYEEFCLVQRFIENSLYTLKPAVKGSARLIREYIDYQKLIELNKLNIQFSEVKEEIVNVGTTLGVGLAEYFGKLANFDEKLAQADIAYSTSVWKNAQRNIERMNPDIEKLINDITNAAIATAKQKELVQGWKTFFLASSMLQQIKDFDISFGSDVIDQANEMKRTAAEYEVLKRDIPGLLNKMKSQVEKIRDAYLENELTFRHVKSLLQSDASFNRLYVDRLKLFLEAYNNFSPAITLSGMAEYTSLVEDLINKCCEIIAGGEGGDAIKEIEKNSCSNVEKKFEAMKAFYEDLGEQQLEIMDAYARMARAQTAKEGAEQLQNSVSNLKVKIKQEIVKKNIKIVLRAHKLLYIESYCDSVSYQGYGRIITDCAYLKANPDASPDHLIAREEPAMCGSKRYKKSKVQRIPVSDSKVVGYLNISALYTLGKDGNTKGYATFKIPDVKWLSDNGWIIHNPHYSGPYALNSIKLHLPPGSENTRATYDIRIKITGNKVGGKSYTFVRVVRDEKTNKEKTEVGTIIANTYTMNADQCEAKNRLNSRYNVPRCQGTPKPVCWNAGHDISEAAVHLPMLVGSNWEITLTSNAALKPLMMSESYVYADVSMCSEIRFKVDRRRRDITGIVPCCAPAKFYNEKTGDCRECPSGQQPFLWDKFCETCPPGYETSEDAYGCKKCPDGKKKEIAGPGQCE